LNGVDLVVGGGRIVLDQSATASVTSRNGRVASSIHLAVRQRRSPDAPGRATVPRKVLYAVVTRLPKPAAWAASRRATAGARRAGPASRSALACRGKPAECREGWRRRRRVACSSVVNSRHSRERTLERRGGNRTCWSPGNAQHRRAIALQLARDSCRGAQRDRRAGGGTSAPGGQHAGPLAAPACRLRPRRLVRVIGGRPRTIVNNAERSRAAARRRATQVARHIDSNLGACWYSAPPTLHARPAVSLMRHRPRAEVSPR
jgi:hypothetical protein